MDDLLPCPWCNGGATLANDGDPKWPITILDSHNEGCPLGFHQLQISYPDEATAITAWNTRSSPPLPSDRMVERVARAINPLWWGWFDGYGDLTIPADKASYEMLLETARRAIRALSDDEGVG